MTAKQKRFIEEYLVDLNATQAAIRAGYSPATASEQGARMLGNVNIKGEIDRQLAERSKRTGISADRVIREMAKIAFANISDVVDLTTGQARTDAARDDLAAVQQIKVRRSETEAGVAIETDVRLADKLKAAELLGKHLGMFRDRLEVSGGLATAQAKLDDLLKQVQGGEPE